MAVISPVSDLRNYNTVLEKVAVGSPVYLTVNGRGRYTIRDIEEDEEFEKTKAIAIELQAQSIPAVQKIASSVISAIIQARLNL